MSFKKVLQQRAPQQQQQEIIQINYKQQSSAYQEFLDQYMLLNDKTNSACDTKLQTIDVQFVEQVQVHNNISFLYENTYGTRNGQIYQITNQNTSMLYDILPDQYISVKQITQNFILFNNGQAYVKQSDKNPTKLELKYEVRWICECQRFILLLDNQNNIWIYRNNNQIQISEQSLIQRLEVVTQNDIEIETLYLINEMIGLQLNNNIFVLISLKDKKIITKLFLETKIRKVLYSQNKIYILSQQVIIFNIKSLKIDYLNYGMYYTADIVLINYQNDQQTLCDEYLIIASETRLIAVSDSEILLFKDIQFLLHEHNENLAVTANNIDILQSFNKAANPKILMINAEYIIWKSGPNTFCTRYICNYS